MKLILILSCLFFSFNCFSETAKNKKTDAKRKKKSITPKEFFKDIKVDSLGCHLGFVKPNDSDGTISFGLDVPFGTITKYKVQMKSSVEYWSSSSVNGDFSDLIFSASANYEFKKIVKFKLTPYAGAGLSMHFYETTIKTTVLASVVTTKGSSTNMGMDLIGGGRFDLKKKFDLFSELKYRIVADAGQLTAIVGAIYKF
jgi:opacity protein-like surface antigen